MPKVCNFTALEPQTKMIGAQKPIYFILSMVVGGVNQKKINNHHTGFPNNFCIAADYAKGKSIL